MPDQDYVRPAALHAEQDREIERLRLVNRIQAERWAADHAELLRLRGLRHPMTREQAVSRIQRFFARESGLD